MALQAENYDPALKAGAQINASNDIALTNTHILVGDSNGNAVDVAMSGEASIANTGAVTLTNGAVIGKVLTGFVSGAGVVAATDTILQAFQKINGNVVALSAAGVGGALTTNHIIVGSAGGIATDVAMSGDVTIVSSGATTIANNAVTNAKIAVDLIQHATVAVSSADILNLNATPKQLVAAPGANKGIIVERIYFKMISTATAYANGGAVEFRYTNAAGAKVTGADLASAVITAAGPAVSFTAIGTNSSANVTAVDNAAIVMDNATAPFITGTGTATVDIWYRVVST